MAENRLARELESRETKERPKQWMRPETLPQPDKQSGYAYRWIRVSSMNQPDAKNISAKLREGWEPVRIEEQPQFKLLVDPNSRFKDNVEVAGLLLCKMPTEFVEQRKDYFARQTQAQVESVDNNFMRENDPRMPLFAERKSTTSFGKGK
jgi:hypothetical protein